MTLYLYTGPNRSDLCVDLERAYSISLANSSDLGFRVEFYYEGKWYLNAIAHGCFLLNGYDIDSPEDRSDG